MLTLLSMAQLVGLNSFSESFIYLRDLRSEIRISLYFYKVTIIQALVSHSDQFVARVQPFYLRLASVHTLHSDHFSTGNGLFTLCFGDIHYFLIVDVLDHVNGNDQG